MAMKAAMLATLTLPPYWARTAWAVLSPKVSAMAPRTVRPMGRCPAAADGPQGFVGYDATPGLFAAQAGQRGPHLPADEGVGLSGLVLRQVLAAERYLGRSKASRIGDLMASISRLPGRRDGGRQEAGAAVFKGDNRAPGAVPPRKRMSG